ncbi:MAG TPA: molybdopterin dinucleotide binding domain-containing protein [Anditalea sp.]|nr:molybdopterin dinucleotide binding domain-containing protein [Anditalea sp.]
MGGVEFPFPPLGVMYAKNLTPDPTTGIGRYSDGQLFRMMRHADKPDGTATLSVLMPFWDMADEDLIAVVSYLRSLDPVTNNVQDNEWAFMGKAVRVIASSFKPIEKPSPPLEKEGKFYLEVNPKDAAMRQIADGDELKVFNQRGRVFITARISNKVKQGVVCMPQGFWPSLLKGGSSANALTNHLLTDMVRGAAIQEAKVEVEKV